MHEPAITVVVPTRNRCHYLRSALPSLLEQQLEAPFEVLVVDDHSTDQTAQQVAVLGAALVRLERPEGLNAARNAGMRAAGSDLVAFVDDDIWAPQGWLQALLDGARSHPASDAFGGPIRPRLEGRAPRSCPRDKAPITALDLGGEDRLTDHVWGANMAIRRSAWERVGPFDESIHGHGDEEDWLRALLAEGGTITYLARAGLDHRRSPADSRLRALAKSAYARGRAARRSDERRAAAPPLHSEARVMAGCAWHLLSRACPQGIIMAAHIAGRLRTALELDATAEQRKSSRAPATGSQA